MTNPLMVHGGLIALRLDGLWRGALISGASGSGKSDLAARALTQGFHLVSDDRTVVFISQGRPFGRAPSALRGLIEIRGIGVLACRCLPLAEIVLAVDCVERPQTPERVPPGESREILGVTIPLLRLWPFGASAPHKLRRGLEHLGAQRQQAYQAALQLRGPCLVEGGKFGARQGNPFGQS